MLLNLPLMRKNCKPPAGAKAFFNQFSQVKLVESCGGKQKTPQKAGLVPRTGFEPVIPP